MSVACRPWAVTKPAPRPPRQGIRDPAFIPGLQRVVQSCDKIHLESNHFASPTPHLTSSSPHSSWMLPSPPGGCPCFHPGSLCGLLMEAARETPKDMAEHVTPLLAASHHAHSLNPALTASSRALLTGLSPAPSGALCSLSGSCLGPLLVLPGASGATSLGRPRCLLLRLESSPTDVCITKGLSYFLKFANNTLQQGTCSLCMLERQLHKGTGFHLLTVAGPHTVLRT